LIQASLAALATAPALIHRPAFAQDAELVIEPARRPFGRVTAGGLAVREYPSTQAAVLRRLNVNDVVEVLGQTVGDGPTTYNPVWFQLPDGFAHSGFVQPAENSLNAPLDAVGPDGLWGEVTVPSSDGRAGADEAAPLLARYPYGCVIRVDEVVAGADGAAWYRISEGDDPSPAFLRAVHVRPITADEIAPLSPDVPGEAKRIEVDLARQQMTAFEYEQPVFSARVSTGAVLTLPDGTVTDRRTTTGEHSVFLKILGQRMNGGSAGDADYYNLPGVSWVSYFTGSGIAFHGTYWHNDYGRPRSRGCVNMLPEDAKWVFRWTQPGPNLDERWIRRAARSAGTRVTVF
jgi:lipoprotein-anchoring transpeptidase ErfK/SrfK